MSLAFRKKLALLLVLGLLVVGSIGYILYTHNPLRAGPPGANAQDLKMLRTIGLLRSALQEIEAAELGYALSGEQTYFIEFGTASGDLMRHLSELKALCRDSVDSLRVIEAVSLLVDQRLRLAEQVVSARSREGRNAAATLIKAGEEKRLAGQVGRELSGLEQNGVRASLDQDRMLEQGVQRNISLVAAAYGAALLIVVLSLLFIGWEYKSSRQARLELQDLKEQFRILFEGQKDMAQFLVAANGTISSWNPAAERLLGFSERDIVGRRYELCFLDEDVKLGRPGHGLRTAETEGRFEQAGPRRRKDGSAFQAQSMITALRREDGRLRGYAVSVRDVTEQKMTGDLLKKLSLTVEQAGNLVVITDRSGRVEFVNRAVEDVTGFTRDEFIAGGMGLLLMDQHDGRRYREMWDTALAGRTFHAEMTAVRKNGELIFLDQAAAPITDLSGSVTHVVFTGSDLTPVKHMRDKLDYLASYDTLTGLPNRDLFTDRLNRELMSDAAVRRTLAVLMIDIDRFKYLNEIYGVEAANSVLKQVAESLSVSVNKGDIVGRLGSDEFGIVLHDVAKPADAILFVKMIMKNVPQIVMSGGKEIAVTLAVGISVCPSDGNNALALMKNADAALAKAKALGRNRYHFYTPGMNEGMTELVFMERRLTDALQNKEYVLAYQPYYHLSTRNVAGAEALLRWNNEEFGRVSPAKFIPMLEETGMINEVGAWVLRTACRQIREWSNGKSHLPVAVNLSPAQFRYDYLAETVENAVREHGIDPHRLTLEVTESTFMRDQDFAVAVLKRLKGIGVSISIDDFGTGYSSLSYLKKFPVDAIKIDQSFVRDVAVDPDTTSLVSAIISMAHSLNLKTIAEGIESEEQWKILRLLKCDMGQGFYFSLAVLPREFEQLMG
ncbi:MAG TPA: EAL domain-containing protein [Nitrospirota bacterium]|nr:EAL domain-containing protein [Nitrospirota bacterium]